MAAQGVAHYVPDLDAHDGFEDRGRARAHCIYFIGAESGPVKIGKAVCPFTRLKCLQTAHHERLTLLAICEGGAGRERGYHRQFKEHRIRGEWFARSPELVAEIERLNEER